MMTDQLCPINLSSKEFQRRGAQIERARSYGAPQARRVLGTDDTSLVSEFKKPFLVQKYFQ